MTPLTREYILPTASRLNIYANGVPEPGPNERFGAMIASTAPIVVERATCSNASSQPGVVWAVGTHPTGALVP